MPTINLPIDETVTKELSNIVVQESRQAVQKALQAEIPYLGKDWLSQNDVCDMLGISRATLIQWKRSGLRVSELSERTIFIHKDELTRFLKTYER